MKSSTYWLRVALIREMQMQKNCTYTVRELERLYDNAIKDLNTEIQKVFKEFRQGVEITKQEAEQLISSAQSEEISKRLQELLENTDDPKQRMELMKKIHAQAYGARISRLEAVKLNVYCYFKEKANLEIKKSKTFYNTTIEESYYRTIHDIAKGCNIGINFSLIPQRAIDEMLTAKWHGTQFSDRVWANTDKTAEKAQEIIARGLLSHKSYNAMADELAAVTDNTKYNASRLVRTQGNHFLNAGELKAYEDLGIEKYKYLATLDYKTCEKCQPLDGKIFLVSEAEEGVNYPTIHPHCRCTTTMPVDYVNRWARDPITGKGVKIPDTTYSEWVENMTDEQKAAFDKSVTMYKNRSSDKKQYEAYTKRLGKENMPKTFDLFQDLKYNYPEKWTDIKGFYRYKGDNPNTDLKAYECVAELKNRGIKGSIHIPPKEIDVSNLGFDDNHINTERKHNVTETEAKEFIKNAKLSKTIWQGQYENYYSEAGASYVDIRDESNKFIRTAFKRHEFNDDSELIMEVLKKYGI